MHQVYPIFTTPIYKCNIPLSPEIVSKVHSASFNRTKLDNGYVSTDRRILDNTLFSYEREIVNEHVDIFTRDYLRVDKCIQFNIENSWIVKHEEGDIAHPHRHINSALSGILYVQVDERSGDLYFHNDINSNIPFNAMIRLPIVEHNIYNSRLWHFTPQNGDLFIFPSALMHSVSQSTSSNSRYCISFNVYPRGQLEKESISALYL